MECIILAAGRSKRMKSRLTKVLHLMAGRPLLHYPVQAAFEAGASRVVVVCSNENVEAIRENLGSAFGASQLECTIQADPRGTGDAVRVGLEKCSEDLIGILCGDTPLVDAENLGALLAAFEQSRASLIVQSCRVADPKGYGRIVRNAENSVLAIREDRELRNEQEHEINEVSAGIYFGKREILVSAVSRLSPNNKQGEYYFTDVVEDIARTTLVSAHVGDADSLKGVNDRFQLNEAESIMYQRIARRHSLAGVTVREGARIEDTVQIEPEAVIEFGVSLRGCTTVGAATVIEVGCVIENSNIGGGALIKPYSVIGQSSVGEGAQIGPFAHIRPGSVLEQDVRIGNFVETKKTVMRRGSKANHLSYLGDGDIGERANIGAGTIFCNYDGYKKHKTIIGSNAFIGSDSQLVAPVVVGSGAYVASGTTVTKDVPGDALAISRVKQENKPGYAIRLRARTTNASEKK